MSKAQTDIRTTSYDAKTANAFGYQGTIEDALEQIRSEPDVEPTISARAELLMFLGVDKVPSAGPSVEMDESPRYGLEPSTDPGFYTLAYAQKHFPESFIIRDLGPRLLALNDAQLRLYRTLREHNDVLASLARAEAYPYPVTQS